MVASAPPAPGGTMVGLIQKILFDLIESLGGADAVRDVKRVAGVPEDKHFRMNDVYSDEEWRRLFRATCQVLKVTQEQAEEAYADVFCKDALRRWPMWFEMSKTAREFLMRQPKIHNGFATGARDPAARKAINDKFQLEARDAELVMHYRSENQLCGLYRALARWIVDHYQDLATIEETQCLKRGAPECEIHIRFAPKEVAR
jgi:hypothetical protein